MKMTKKAALAGLAALTLAAMVATPTYARRGSDDDGNDESEIEDRAERGRERRGYDDDFDDDGVEDDEDEDRDNDGVEDDEDRDDWTATTTAARAQLKLLKKEQKRGKALENADLSCLSAAVAAREDALIAALDEFNADAKTALSERKSDLADAYAKTDRKEVKEAVKSAWKNYKDAMKSARGELKDDKKSAYGEFKSAAKECGGSVESTDTSAPGEEILL